MLTAITRAVSPGIVQCELTFVPRQPIDLAKAQSQHRAYQQALEKAGVRVISLPAEPALPDSMFVEDPALVLDELAVIFPLGTETRRASAAGSSPGFPAAPMPKVFANCAPFSLPTVTKSLAFPSPDACT